VVEGARLESVYTLIAYRGFESLLLRQTNKASLVAGFFHLTAQSATVQPSPELRAFARAKAKLLALTETLLTLLRQTNKASLVAGFFHLTAQSATVQPSPELRAFARAKAKLLALTETLLTLLRQTNKASLTAGFFIPQHYKAIKPHP
jgi:hypothetical protein